MTGFKQIEMEVKRMLKALRNGGKNCLYEIATRCVALFNGQDEYASEIGIEPEQIPEHINSVFLRDFAVDLGDLITLLKVFPDKDQWDRPLLDLLESAEEQIRGESRNERQHAASRRTVKVKDYEAVQSKLKDAEYQLDRQSATMQKLREENEELRRENSRLEGRIQELERLLARKVESVFA